MPIRLPHAHPTLLIRKAAFERVGLERRAIDERLGLTDEEFRVEGGLIVVGPVHDEEALAALFEEFDALGLVHFDDWFDLSGTWPEWLSLYVAG